MDEEARAASAAAFLYRYLLARARYRSVDLAVRRLSEADLACHLGGKRREFDEVVVNPEADPPITNDAKHRDFFHAIVNKAWHDPRQDGARTGRVQELCAEW